MSLSLHVIALTASVASSTGGCLHTLHTEAMHTARTTIHVMAFFIVLRRDSCVRRRAGSGGRCRSEGCVVNVLEEEGGGGGKREKGEGRG